MPTQCSPIQHSLGWCKGKVQLAGIRDEVYRISKDLITKWPTREKLQNGARGPVYTGSFELADGATFKKIAIIPEKSQFTSEAAGEKPSQLNLNKLSLVHPGVGQEAAQVAGEINNSDDVVIFRDIEGNFRVVGNELYETKGTAAQDLGQGATGSTSTTITYECHDYCPAPFYDGSIMTEDGDINPQGSGSGSGEA